MNSFFSSIRSRIRRYRSELEWKAEVSVCRNTIRYNDKPILLNNGVFLILIPHADDEWIGCSQLVCNKNKEVILFNMDMRGDDDDDLHLVRRKELEHISSQYSRRMIHVGEDKVNSLKENLLIIKPDYICLPYFFDWHPEHIEVMRILDEATQGLSYGCSVMMYQVSLPILPIMCNFWLPMTKYQQKTKWRLFEKIYKTQKKIPYRRMACNEMINGAIAGCYAAEVFCITTLDLWKKQLFTYLLNKNEMDDIKLELRHIIRVREMLSNYINKRQ